MSKATRITQIIEGFKLGSLGAGHKPPKYIEPSEPEDVKQPEPEIAASDHPEDKGYKVSGEDWAPAPTDPSDSRVITVKWVETGRASDSVKYRMVLNCFRPGAKKRYWIQVFGGKRTIVTFNPVGITGYSFEASYPAQFPTDKAVETYVKSLMNQIDRNGSFGFTLATGNLGLWRFSLTSQEQSYLKDTCGIIKSQHFYKG